MRVGVRVRVRVSVRVSVRVRVRVSVRVRVGGVRLHESDDPAADARCVEVGRGEADAPG